jgi:hypothetical protein
MRPRTLEDAIREVVFNDYGLIDYDDMVDDIAEKIRQGFILPILNEHGLPVPNEA